MTISQQAIIEPSLLVWARKSIGFEIDEAAKKIGVDPDKLSHWEKGAPLSIPQLRRIAAVYKRPLAVFYLSKAPDDFKTLQDFRRFPGVVARPSSSDYLYLLRKIEQRRDVALELKEYYDYGDAAFVGSAKLSDNIVTLAKKIRTFLGISLEQQVLWKDKYEALSSWIEAVEKKGVLVFQSADVSKDEFRGFSINEKIMPVIVLNANDSHKARIFTLLHELTHLFLNTGGICDLHNIEHARLEKDKIEVFCNAVAGETLVPSDILKRNDLLEEVVEPKEWTDDEIFQLAKFFNVSTEVVVRRLLSLGLATEEFYLAKRKEYQDAEQSYKEELKRKQKEKDKGGFAPPDVIAVRDLGRTYSSVILDAYHNQSITASDVSEYLDVKLKHLPKIEMHIAKKK